MASSSIGCSRRPRDRHSCVRPVKDGSRPACIAAALMWRLRSAGSCASAAADRVLAAGAPALPSACTSTAWTWLTLLSAAMGTFTDTGAVIAAADPRSRSRDDRGDDEDQNHDLGSDEGDRDDDEYDDLDAGEEHSDGAPRTAASSVVPGCRRMVTPRQSRHAAQHLQGVQTPCCVARVQRAHATASGDGEVASLVVQALWQLLKLAAQRLLRLHDWMHAEDCALHIWCLLLEQVSSSSLDGEPSGMSCS
jgi:hypothetical protein